VAHYLRFEIYLPTKFTVSLPFSAGEYKQCDVKIIDDRGIESLQVLHLNK